MKSDEGKERRTFQKLVGVGERGGVENGKTERGRDHFGGVERGFEDSDRVDYMREGRKRNSKSLCGHTSREGWRVFSFFRWRVINSSLVFTQTFVTMA